MKRVVRCIFILGLLSVPMFAATNSKNVNFPKKVTVGATQLPAGEYKVSWTGAGASAQVKIVQLNVFRPLTVTVTAKVENMQSGATGVNIVEKNGVDTLATIQLNKVKLVFDGASTPAQ